MHLDWNQLSPISSTLGGILIGLAAVFLFAGIGRIAGITGIVAGILKKPNQAQLWRYAFIAGLLVSPLIYTLFADLPSVELQGNWTTLAWSGLLVGIGTRLSNGCTSGHGVCGLSRLSLRSLVATLCFMTSGFLTVFILRHVLSN